VRPERYFGIEPNAWLIEDAIRYEIGPDMIRIKRPTFDHNSDFTLTVFDEAFHYMVAQSIMTHVSQAHEVYDGDRWSYPRFSSYPIKFVIAKAREHGLSAHPLIWADAHDHY
jgi:hypothetical protein